jgi:hypothetical protein
LLGRHWRYPRSELGFVTRSLAGAASRVGPVSVLVPGAPGAAVPDGLFDIIGIGRDGELRDPGDLARDAVVIADELTAEAATVISNSGLASRYFLSAEDHTAGPPWRRLSVVPDEGAGSSCSVHPYVPVNSLAAQDRHHGFGFTNYHLVLGGVTHSGDDPPTAIAWLTAAFHEADVVFVSDGIASAWRGRALRGQTTVDTQTDFWRLLAHACVCIDLDPGPLIARECIEALRFGTPIVVSEGSGPAVTHARAGGGFTFEDAEELIDAVGRMQIEPERLQVAARGRRYADETFGDPAQLVADMRELLAHA